MIAFFTESYNQENQKANEPMSVTSREKLHQQIDQLPDHIVEQIANFTSSIMTQQNNIPEYGNWKDKDWQKFSLQEFFREDDEIEYSLEDAQEIYKP